ncbi:hypothetical protein NPS49_09260 [Pseudomonas putida]|uniref:hypothetical protein n=1 Tax=Pseudomonas putida TaxID=303 RepID=UPI0023644777|nr:hypothetical protein [Pseudomonas putida]MDD2068509.1 hypothetical protein [Pseudomonas putida]HDS1739686.1 hypothetical protein [Pseudomonas putida]
MSNREERTAENRREMLKVFLRRLKNDPKAFKSFLKQLGHQHITTSYHVKMVETHLRNDEAQKLTKSDPKK